MVNVLENFRCNKYFVWEYHLNFGAIEFQYILQLNWTSFDIIFQSDICSLKNFMFQEYILINFSGTYSFYDPYVVKLWIFCFKIKMKLKIPSFDK